MQPSEFEAAFREAREELQSVHSHGGVMPVPDEKVYAYLSLKSQRKALGEMHLRFGRLSEKLAELEKRLDASLLQQNEHFRKEIETLKSRLQP